MSKQGAAAGEPARASTAASKPFLLATFFDGRPEDGGGFVHKTGLLHVLRKLEGPDLKVVVICDSEYGLGVVREAGLAGIIKRRTAWHRALGTLSSMPVIKRYLGHSAGKRLSSVDRLLTRLKADLVFFPGPDARALQLYSHRYIFSIWDLAHLEHPEFPEVSAFGEFERREYIFGRGAGGAIAVIADSRPACELIADSYRIPASRIYAAPFLISPSIYAFRRNPEEEADVRRKYGLKDPYIFYPAQFWPHKNHRYILAALRVMLERYCWAPQAVFCGSDKGALGSIMDLADELGVRHLVNYCGFVPYSEMPYLYAGALSLVMPTYFGPSNLPPMEALSLGVPVCYSDFPSFREVMGDAVTYVDLAQPVSLASAIEAIRIQKAQSVPDTKIVATDHVEAARLRYLSVLREIVTGYRQKIGASPQRPPSDSMPPC